MICSTNPSSTNIRCLQINLRHSRAAAMHLSQLLLDLEVDVAFIQEPYAVSAPYPSLKYVPDGYVQLHSLTTDHAYGAAIIAKRNLYPSMHPLEINNCAAGVKITVRNQPFYLFSIYCRPSIRDLRSFLLSFFHLPSSTLNPRTASRSILCLDSNAMNPLWNSKTLDDKGSAMENFCRSLGLTVCNVALHHLSHCPTNTSFPDITLAGDYANISGSSTYRLFQTILTYLSSSLLVIRMAIPNPSVPRSPSREYLRTRQKFSSRY